MRKLLKLEGSVRAEHPGISAFSLEVPLKTLLKLGKANNNIQSISLDAPVGGMDLLGTTTATTENHVRATLGLTPASNTGVGVGIAIVDSGIYPSPDFANRITAFYDFTRGGIATAPHDNYGHGTHVAGLAAGSGAMSSGKYKGVA